MVTFDTSNMDTDGEIGISSEDSDDNTRILTNNMKPSQKFQLTESIRTYFSNRKELRKKKQKKNTLDKMKHLPVSLLRQITHHHEELPESMKKNLFLGGR